MSIFVPVEKKERKKTGVSEQVAKLIAVCDLMVQAVLLQRMNVDE